MTSACSRSAGYGPYCVVCDCSNGSRWFPIRLFSFRVISFSKFPLLRFHPQKCLNVYNVFPLLRKLCKAFCILGDAAGNIGYLVLNETDNNRLLLDSEQSN